MITRLKEYSDTVDDETAFDIDIIGFSRGAAQARDFANQIVSQYRNGYYQYRDNAGQTRCQKVNFRFMGLWDTVLSTHTGSYQLRIPDIFTYVAHAVALNEYRGGAIAFPQESIRGVPASNDRTRIERGFLGAHSDIGGGFPERELSKVVLAWMVDQARQAGVRMRSLDPADTIVSAQAEIHDKSSNLLTGQPTTSSEDRTVRYMDGTRARQRQATGTIMEYRDTEPFIRYKPNPTTRDYVSGTVDMQAYLAWLNQHGYNINLRVEGL